jgi:hypothetical protein
LRGNILAGREAARQQRRKVTQDDVALDEMMLDGSGSPNQNLIRRAFGYALAGTFPLVAGTRCAATMTILFGGLLQVVDKNALGAEELLAPLL